MPRLTGNGFSMSLGELSLRSFPAPSFPVIFFASLGSTPMLGRIILPEDDQPGANNQVVILSYTLWRSRFGADPDILGRTLMVNAEPYSVLGVMPPGFDFPNQSERWCPLVPGGGFHENRRAHLLTVLADVARGKSNGDVSGELTAIAKRVEERNPGLDDPGLSLAAIPLQRSLTAPVRPALVILFFAVGLLLVIACSYCGPEQGNCRSPGAWCRPGSFGHAFPDRKRVHVAAGWDAGTAPCGSRPGFHPRAKQQHCRHPLAVERIRKKICVQESAWAREIGFRQLHTQPTFAVSQRKFVFRNAWKFAFFNSSEL